MATPIQFGLSYIIRTKIGTIAIDVTLNQMHEFPSRITENPVEDGTVYSDHQILLPAILEIDGRVTDASISPETSFSGKTNALDAYRRLVALQKDRVPFDVATGLNLYHNMLLERLSIPRSSDDGKSLRFTALMKEVQIVGRDVPTNRDIIAPDIRHTALPVRALGAVNLS
jgi:hypothetical protein